MEGIAVDKIFLFRSTGSYEPDPSKNVPSGFSYSFRSTGSYEPDRKIHRETRSETLFRSTGSYEPDLVEKAGQIERICFDPQALTSLTPKRPVRYRMN